jgi:hypothetical protein
VQGWTFKQRAVVLVALGVLCLVYFRHRIYNGLAGPSDLEVRDLGVMQEVPSQPYVRVVRDGRPVEYTELAKAPFYEAEVRDDGNREAARFRYLDAAGRRLLVRVTRSSDREVLGVLKPLKDTTLATQAPGDVLYVDCEDTHYRLISLLLLGLGVMAIGLGIDQLRRALREA